ncbi:hypothetical protein ILP92_14545 [Maribius pontilimi]|uniref:Uncharacterized protein n=1 Tax=Palleronia pontilimi TaxID=1964209 RepID=A0A934MDI9_9RHOB|nr:hypothetical protein [Palleronia pontilimi]MBJ3763968.1 hypothetical protein [Palleronia pontilimi]
MPLDKFVLILVVVMLGAGLTIWLMAVISASLTHPLGFTLFIPLVLVTYVLWRVVAQRLTSRDDDHYDSTPR